MRMGRDKQEQDGIIKLQSRGYEKDRLNVKTKPFTILKSSSILFPA